MKKNDCILAGLAIALALALYFIIPKESANIAKISVDGKIYATVFLDKDQTIEINDTNVAIVENGGIYMESATCPDKLCINQGRISDSSKKIVCLPNKVVIEAVKDGENDAVVK